MLRISGWFTDSRATLLAFFHEVVRVTVPDLPREKAPIAPFAHRPICSCHSSDLYATLFVCPQCNHRSLDWSAYALDWAGCERRRCGYEWGPGTIEEGRLFP